MIVTSLDLHYILSLFFQGIGGKGIKRVILLNGSGLAPWALSSREDWLTRELARQLNVTMPASTKNKPKKPPSEDHTLSSNVRSPTYNADVKLHNSSAATNSSFANVTAKQPTLSEKLLQLLKVLPISRIIQLQECLNPPPFTTLLGPVLLHHLFPRFLIDRQDKELESQNSMGNTPFKQMPSPRSPIHLERTLFSSVDLLVGTTQQLALNFYNYSQWDNQWADSLLNFTHALYPSNWKSITELLKFVYMKTYKKEEFWDSSFKASKHSRSEASGFLIFISYFLTKFLQHE